MRYLGLALSSEGPTDQRFLAPLLRRVVEDLCLRYANSEVIIPDIQAVKGRGTEIVAELRQAIGQFDILFIHADGAGDYQSARAQIVEPVIALIERENGMGRMRPVAVIPIRETEAWALVDGVSLRAVFGTRLNDAELGVPRRPRDVERISDPKQALRIAYSKAVGVRPSSKRRNAAGELQGIGERVNLDSLRHVPAFQRFEDELRHALEALGYLQ